MASFNGGTRISVDVTKRIFIEKLSTRLEGGKSLPEELKFKHKFTMIEI